MRAKFKTMPRSLAKGKHKNKAKPRGRRSHRG